ncbi:MAG: hypothetical protein ACLU36_13005, partial [Barnesiella intestinihominis]
PSVSLASSPPDKGGIGDCAFACINPLALRALPLYLLRKTPRNATGHGRGVLKAAFQFRYKDSIVHFSPVFP